MMSSLSTLMFSPPSGLKSKAPDFTKRRKKKAPVATSSPESSEEEEEEEEKEDDEEWTPSVSGNPNSNTTVHNSVSEVVLN